MSAGSQDRFVTVRTEGGLLPADLLARVAEGDRDLDGLTPEAYHLAAGERLNEAITRAWNRLTAAWPTFRAAAAKLPETDPGTSLTRERWLLILFQELGYGRLPASRGLEVGGKAYPVSHLWGKTPIHLVGVHVDLDRRTAGVAGAARTSPHGLVQELLTRSSDHLWGFVSNGLRLRLLRDNASLTRQAFVEFDLEAMMEGEVYADFVLLWLLAHQSRVEGEKPEECWLERWARAAGEQGTRALDRLRDGVEAAITALGRGFVAHPANTALRDRLRAGTLSTQDYYRQLLRLVYRLLFLFVAEDRDLLLDPKADPAARERYTRFYSTARLRRLAERTRGTRHPDRYRGLRLVMERLGSDAGYPPLGLPALGSFLWSTEAIPDLAAAELANHDLLEAVRALAFTVQERVLRPVDYKNLGSEELGSVYESLLELHPEVNADAHAFELKTAGGHERKATGSYYTRADLIKCLLDSALDPVLEEAARKPDPEHAILGLKVCDPACGSGHFLIAAAHRIARRLAAIRTGDEEPSPEATHTALRDVIGHCLYGVDVNPMAVELCKVSLWMEALEPGKPLSFLEHRILCGNSLLGATPALLDQGIPEKAFEFVEGDDKNVASALRRRNRQERKGQMALPLVADRTATYGTLTERFSALDAIGDQSITAIREKEATYRRLAASPEYDQAHLIADAWCAVFFWRKARDAPPPITHDVFLRLCRDPASIPADVRREVTRLAADYRFFHWHLAFPDVFRGPKDAEPENRQAGWSGGFDLVLGNPPWDTLSPDAKEFFSAYDPSVRFQDPEGQAKLIEQLLSDPAVAAAWSRYCRDQAHFFKESGRYRLFAPGNLGKGDFNVYRMFVETAMEADRPGGWVSQVAPENLYNGANAAAIRQALFEQFQLSRLLGFENARETWFKGIDSRTKFCIYAARRGGRTDAFHARFTIRSVPQLAEVQAGNSLRVPVALVKEFSPDALAVMEFQGQLDIDIATKMYARWPKFGDESAGPPHRVYMAEVHMGNDRELFDENPSGLPVYEGRMVWQYDHRAKGYRSGRGRAAEWEHVPFGDPKKSIQPQWYIPRHKIPDKTQERVQRYRVGFCDVASPTNERTLVAALIPPRVICGHKVPTFVFEPEFEWMYMVWLAAANSFAMDFLARKKVSLTMSFTVLDSLPFPRRKGIEPWAKTLVPLALQLSATGSEMTPYWNAMAQEGWVRPVPPDTQSAGIVDEAQRMLTRAEIEALVARDVFGLSREELEYILTTFPVAQRYEEERFGEFRTRRLILESLER